MRNAFCAQKLQNFFFSLFKMQKLHHTTRAYTRQLWNNNLYPLSSTFGGQKFPIKQEKAKKRKRQRKKTKKKKIPKPAVEEPFHLITFLVFFIRKKKKKKEREKTEEKKREKKRRIPKPAVEEPFHLITFLVFFIRKKKKRKKKKKKDKEKRNKKTKQKNKKQETNKEKLWAKRVLRRRFLGAPAARPRVLKSYKLKGFFNGPLTNLLYSVDQRLLTLET